MTQLATILEQPARQMTIDEYLGLDRDRDPQMITAGGQRGAPRGHEIGARSHVCEVEARCRQAKGMAKMRCGYIGAGTVGACAARRQLLGGGDVPK